MSICREYGCTGAILKARSPSRGKGVIYDGCFTGTRVPGSGVFAQMLLDMGIPVMTEEEYLVRTCGESEAVASGRFSVKKKSEPPEGGTA